jgi:peptidoglycan hydrolase CwlO-like protein
MGKIKKSILFIIGLIGSILAILLAAKAKGRKINPKIAKNDEEVKRLESQIQDVKAEKEILNNELTDLTKTADGRSKEVKDAKKNVKKNDQTIADLEAALAEAEKNL